MIPLKLPPTAALPENSPHWAEMSRSPRTQPPGFPSFTQELREGLSIEILYEALYSKQRLEKKLKIARDMSSNVAVEMMQQLVEGVNALRLGVEEVERHASDADKKNASQIDPPAGFDVERGPQHGLVEWLWTAKHELRRLEARHDLGGGSAEALEESVFSETVEERTTSSQETRDDSAEAATLDSTQSDAA